jgi:cytolysin-activating lysine-acyltransferase
LENPQQHKMTEETRQRINAAVGQVALAMSAVPRYRQLPIGDLQALVLDPLIRNKIAIATAQTPDGVESPAGISGGAIAGIAIWASVSDAVDAKIREQIAAGMFPVRIHPMVTRQIEPELLKAMNPVQNALPT